MSTTKAITKPTQEPVSLSLFKAHLRLTTEQIAEDEILSHYLSAARGKAEKYTNQFFTSRTLETTFDVLEKFELQDGAGTVQSVTGFITSIEDLPQVSFKWLQYQKGIIINREYPLDYDNLPTYTVRYDINPEVEADVIQAILLIAADMHENRENSQSGVLNRPISINYKRLLAPYRVGVNG